MKRFLRVAFSIIALVVVVAIVAIGSLIYFIDPNKMRPVIVEEVMNRTGYQLAIYGKLNWRLFPVVGINVERMTLTAPDQVEPFMDLRNIAIASQLSQLIHGNRSLEGNVRISDVRLMNIHAQNAHVKLNWNKDVLTLSPIRANLYGGSLSGVAHGTSLNAVPRWDWDVTIKGVQLQPLLVDANKGRSKLNVSGKGEVTMTANTSGADQEQMLNNLKGKTTFTVSKGSVRGLDVNYLIKTADALITHEQVAPPSEGVSETTFDSLAGTITMNKGVATTNDILLNAPAFSTKAEGTINLLYQAINFALQVKPTDESKVKWEIPVLVTGNLNEPDVRLDVNQLQSQITQQQIDKVKEKVKNEITTRVPGKAGEALQNLLGN